MPLQLQFLAGSRGGVAYHQVAATGLRLGGFFPHHQLQCITPPVTSHAFEFSAATRSGQWFVEGLSPRAGIAVLRAAKARALLAQRGHVAPDDIQAILPQTTAHRLVPVSGAGKGRVEQVRAMLRAVPLP